MWKKNTEKSPSALQTTLLALFSSVAQLCLTLRNPMDCSMPGFHVLHQLPELAQTHVHQVGDAIQPPYPLSSPSRQRNAATDDNAAEAEKCASVH